MRVEGRQSVGALLLVTVYGIVAIGEQALHALMPCGSCACIGGVSEASSSDHHHHGESCEHEQRPISLPVPGESTPEEGRRPHDAGNCVICQWCTQSQLTSLPVALQVGEHPVEEPVCQPPAPLLVRAELPPDVRGPPLS